MIKNINEVTKTLGFKIIIIVVLGLLLLIPMTFINSVVKDRIRYQNEAISSIIEPVGDSANIQGVVIAIPYLEKFIDSDTKEIGYTRKYIFYMPNEYNVTGDVEVTSLSRGIFKAPIFNSKLNITGRFDKYNAEIYNLDENNTIILYDEAMIILGIGNKKNLMKLPNILINQNEELKYYEKNINIDLNMFNNKFLYTISRDSILNGFDFNITMDIQGGNSLIITPLASENTFKISSKWKDPSFTGGFLPTKREVNNNGFNAEWNIASFNTSFTKYWTSDENSNRLNNIDNNQYYTSNQESNNVLISFLLLNDNYQKTSRSVKYAILFIFIPFFVLFLCEVLSKKRIHPVQYILIGIANAIFYLLLLAISEHINFNISYFLSALMVTALTSIYIGYIIKSPRYTISMAIVESLIYIFLFGILQLTDYALLMGTLGLFAVIALAMYFTRNVDWYGENN
ncbi:cell envelope integrity protein CreD [Brachyspira pilosicoli]|uniref:Inner membrane protein n=2 Tax=Brachyspira pilosicoli TaxID=52584 RepID=K0JKQ2_BRAPL|nr:cell envelope integrity protein CreD [Brachyspira pilosicoli]AFR71502.1 inner membrane protein [Brachyspira pilosicoli B2904]MBW5381993.1 cell envelope integrity protein CreD [Brachyspira pilosicoli]WIH81201.1 cell envelope integrity protein CreD [Brachyspira pilosicoli]WIH83402.1 cell envelope integrity protein CreD [Brachyspira pilosicoli]WIH85638.1 cell envelope integrity protein CreD [Brachyspira pilosicoli]